MNQPLKPTIILDRDGVLNNNSQAYYTYKTDEFIWIDGVFENLRKLQQIGFQFVIISNQGGISKKVFSKTQLNQLNEWILETLTQQRIEVKAIFCCPHHNEIENCFCRKPQALFFERAIHRFNIDIENSIMIGDSQRDIAAAAQVGIKGILVKPNKNWKEAIRHLL